MNNENNINAPNNNINSSGRKGRQTQKKEKPKERFAMKQEQFETKKGIRALYEKTKELKLDEFSQVNVQNTMKKIVVLFKSWHYQMVPKYSFDYFLQRCQVLGQQKRLAAYMSKVRKIHKGTQQWQDNEPQSLPGVSGVDMENNDNNNRFQNQIHSEMQILNPPRITTEQEDEDQDNLFELMEKMEHKIDKKQQNIEEYQPYVPEGFQANFPSQQQEDI